MECTIATAMVVADWMIKPKKNKTMRNKVAILLLLSWLTVSGLLSAQEKGFLFTYADNGHSWLAKDAIETESGDFFIGTRNKWGDESVLLKLSPEGHLISELPLAAEDTTVLLSHVLFVPDEQYGDYVALCPCEPVDGNQAALLFVRFDDNLNVTLRKAVSCPFVEQGERFFSVKAIAMDASIFAAFTMQQGASPPLKPTVLVEMDGQGDFIRCQQLDSGSVCNLFEAGQNRIGLFGGIGPAHMGILTFDDSLQLISKDSIFQWTMPEGSNGDLCHYHIADVINSQTAMLPDGSYMVSARLNESLLHANGYSYKNDRSVILARYENDFHQPESMIVVEHMNDSVEYPAFYRSLDFRETNGMECEMFQCAILNERPQFGLLQPYPTGIVVTKTDQDLNIVWKKRFLRDGNYQAMTIDATADGGCLVVGSIGDYQAQRLGVFALKINAGGTVGINEIQEESMAFIYPNPAKETLKIGGVEAKETQVYNALGQCVMTFCGNETNVGTLATGVYLLKITDAYGKRQTIRVIVTE